MDKKTIEENLKVYEIGYLLVSSVPAEKIEAETASLKEILSKKGAEIIGEEAPELLSLAYEMSKKISSSYHRFEKGYFGWIKFALSREEIESVKKSFEENPNMLRVLVINTIRENTYLGKKSTVPTAEAHEVAPEVAVENVEAPVEPKVSTEEIDKSIDAIVKEV